MVTPPMRNPASRLDILGGRLRKIQLYLRPRCWPSKPCSVRQKMPISWHGLVNNLLFNIQLKEKISTIGDGHEAEVDGMKEQIANMTAELHKR